MRGLVLRALDEDRRVGEPAVLSAMVEVQVADDHGLDVAHAYPVRLQLLGQRPDSRLVELLDAFVAGTNAGVEEQRAVGMVDEKRKDRAGLAVPRMALRQCDVGEVERLDPRQAVERH